MRPTEDHVSIIHDTVTDLLGEEASVYLFGSRVDDGCRRGDIDLYIEAFELDGSRTRIQTRLQRSLWGLLGPRRIDLLIRLAEATLRPIHRDTLEQGVRL
ncbi:hypothetical protein SAMN04488129_106136 [Halomonas daqiaonensis]|uniref:Nucleotidyltransferase domain-containing protein n=2 Tax=Halomonas daqiaonensis TaxID=650850 RepID=A0A1H7M5K1_9GAMM|nr:hypothetical protein SAMN04488129_106136 [Halomonas daqiaonensis]